MTTSKAQSPPYPSAARISDSECYPAYSASLKCLEVFNSDKSKCQEHFDIYKECRKKEVHNNSLKGKMPSSLFWYYRYFIMKCL
ncbi:hypothetical protein ACS0TY_003488 [Phlomoides rotata]